MADPVTKATAASSVAVIAWAPMWTLTEWFPTMIGAVLGAAVAMSIIPGPEGARWVRVLRVLGVFSANSATAMLFGRALMPLAGHLVGDYAPDPGVMAACVAGLVAIFGRPVLSWALRRLPALLDRKVGSP